MPMLSLKPVPNLSHPRNPGGGYCYLYDGDKQICIIEEWAFHSCGCGTIMRFGLYSVWWTKENVDRLIALLKTTSHYSVHYTAKEFYFCITTSQKKSGCLDGLIHHPNVKF